MTVADEKKKICTRCRAPKFLDEFPRDRRRIDGHHSQCKACRSRRSLDAPPAELSPEGWAWLGATRRLIDLHEDTFIKLLYSESVAAKLIEPTPAAFRKRWKDYRL